MRYSISSAAVTFACALFAVATTVQAADKSAAPAAVDYPKLVAHFLNNRPDYRPGDLLTISDVEPIFNALIEAGKQPAANEELYDSFLPDRDYLAQTLRTPEGRKFMRAVSHLPQVYDRLERLAWSETGRKILASLVASEDGPKTLERMLEPDGLAAIEKALANDPRGRNFQLPTGKTHTAAELIEQLQAQARPRAREVD